MIYMKNLAIITARSGSKGLKNKNVKKLNGQPLMAYTIDAAMNSGCFCCVHLSTDSRKYADIGMQYGCEVPFMRKEELSNDIAGSWDVVRWVVKEYEKLGRTFDTVALLQPTSPLRNCEDIRLAYERFYEKNAEAVVSVSEVDHSPLWSNTLPEDLKMDDFEDEALENIPRQELPIYYRMNGAIYITTIKHLMTGQNIYKKNCFAYIMPKERSMDIDSEIDFSLAEIMLVRERKYST